MGTKWSQNRRKHSSTLSIKSKKRSPSAETSQVSADASFPGCSVQRKSCKPQHEFLTDDEQIALVRSWEVIKSSDLQLIGIKVLTRIFEIEPETKQTFSNFRNLSTVELLENPKFKSHAIRFMRAVEVTMENLNALDVIIIPNLKHLGQLHTDISGFKLSYLKAVEKAMDETWKTIHEGKPIVVHGYKGRATPTGPATSTPVIITNNNNDDEFEEKIFPGDVIGCPTTGTYEQLTRCAWMKVFHLITSKIMEGYHEGLEVKLVKERSKVKGEGTPSGMVDASPSHRPPTEMKGQQVVVASLPCHPSGLRGNDNQGRCVVGHEDDDDDDVGNRSLADRLDSCGSNDHQNYQDNHHHHDLRHQHQHHHYHHNHNINNNGDLTQKPGIPSIKFSKPIEKVVPFCPAPRNGPI